MLILGNNMENQNTNPDIKSRNHSNGLLRTLGIVLLGTGIGALGGEWINLCAQSYAQSNNPGANIEASPEIQKGMNQLGYLAIGVGAGFGAVAGLRFLEDYSGKK